MLRLFHIVRRPLHSGLFWKQCRSASRTASAKNAPTVEHPVRLSANIPFLLEEKIPQLHQFYQDLTVEQVNDIASEHRKRFKQFDKHNFLGLGAGAKEAAPANFDEELRQWLMYVAHGNGQGSFAAIVAELHSEQVFMPFYAKLYEEEHLLSRCAKQNGGMASATGAVENLVKNLNGRSERLTQSAADPAAVAELVSHATSKLPGITTKQTIFRYTRHDVGNCIFSVGGNRFLVSQTPWSLTSVPISPAEAKRLSNTTECEEKHEDRLEEQPEEQLEEHIHGQPEKPLDFEGTHIGFIMSAKSGNASADLSLVSTSAVEENEVLLSQGVVFRIIRDYTVKTTSVDSQNDKSAVRGQYRSIVCEYHGKYTSFSDGDFVMLGDHTPSEGGSGHHRSVQFSRYIKHIMRWYYAKKALRLD